MAPLTLSCAWLAPKPCWSPRVRDRRDVATVISKWRLNSTSRHTGPHAVQAAGALLPGFISYGTSILLYVYSQRILGAARTAT